MNRQLRTTKDSGSTSGARRSRARSESSWLRVCHATCPNAGKVRFDIELAAFSGVGTLLHESREGPWRYGPFCRCTRGCTGCTPERFFGPYLENRLIYCFQYLINKAVFDVESENRLISEVINLE